MIRYLAAVAAMLAAGPAISQVQAVRTAWPPVWGDTGFGVPVYPAGDVNQDGAADFAVGARESDGGGPYVDAGRAYIYSGATLAPIVTFASPAQVPNGRFGAIRPVGHDFDADGKHDFLVEDPGAAQFRLYSGASGALIRSYARQGEEVAAIVGDLSGDGVPDIALGDQTYGPCSLVQLDTRGRVRLISGLTGQPIQAIEGPCPAGRLGTGVRGLGDLTGDGRPEFAALANSELRFYDGATRQRIDAPPTSFAPGPGAAYTPDRANGVLPYARIGDANGDGVADVAVARMDLDQIGLYSGTGLAPLRTIPNPDAAQYGAFGRGVLGVGDLTGDGVAELGVSSVLEQEGQNGVFLILDGATDAVIARMTASGPDQWWMFGNHVALPGDMDGDGTPDFVFGVATRDQAFVYSGAEFITVANEHTPAPAGSPRLTAWPNPARHAASVRFELPAAGAFRLALLDALGRQVVVIDEGVRPAGPHNSTLSLAGLAPGAYAIRLEGSGHVVTARISVIP